jgi:hypothetical protein
MTFKSQYNARVPLTVRYVLQNQLLVHDVVAMEIYPHLGPATVLDYAASSTDVFDIHQPRNYLWAQLIDGQWSRRTTPLPIVPIPTTTTQTTTVSQTTSIGATTTRTTTVAAVTTTGSTTTVIATSTAGGTTSSLGATTTGATTIVGATTVPQVTTVAATSTAGATTAGPGATTVPQTTVPSFFVGQNVSFASIRRPAAFVAL